MVIMQPFLDGIKGEFEMDMQKLIIAISFVIMISCILLMIFIVVFKTESRMTPAAFLTFGFAVALTCGAQFPAALHLGGGDNPAATRAFSADLMFFTIILNSSGSIEKALSGP